MMMWNRSVVLRKVEVAAWCAALGIGTTVLHGCSPAGNIPSEKTESETTSFETAVEAPEEPMAAAPAAPEQPDVPALLGKISSADNMLDWYDVRNAADAKVPEVGAALAAREQELLAEFPGKPISDAVELVGFDWKIDDEAAAEGQEATFQIRWLFKALKPISLEEGQDIRLVLRGYFDKSHQHYFEDGKRDFELTFRMDPPVTDWSAGSYQFFSMKPFRPLPNIPYRFQTFFSIVKESEEGKWSYVARYGQAVDCGWQVDLGESLEPDAAPKPDAAPATDTPATDAEPATDPAPAP